MFLGDWTAKNLSIGIIIVQKYRNILKDFVNFDYNFVVVYLLIVHSC